MLKTVFLLFLMVIWFEASESNICTYSKNPDVAISMETLKNSTGHCESKISFEINGNIGKYLISVDKYVTTEEEFLTNLGIYAIGGISELKQELKPFRPDYKFYPNIGYYKFHEDPLAWPDARRKCADEGGHLLIINSQEEADTIIQLIALHPLEKLSTKYDFILLGIHDYFKDGEFLTVLGEPLKSTGYVKWGANQPSSGTVENCGSLSRTTAEFNDFPCGWAATFICEKEIEYQTIGVAS